MKRAKTEAKRKLSQKKSKRGLGCVGSVKLRERETGREIITETDRVK